MKKLIALIIALPLFAGGEVWMNIGYGQSNKEYDEDGKEQDMGGTFSVFNLNLGGKYEFYKFPTIDLGIFGGAGFALQQRSFSPDQGEDFSSGFSPQNLSIFLGAKSPFVSGKLGYLLDMGPEPDYLNEKIENSDRQNALFFALNGHLPNPMFSLSGGISYVLTFEKEEEGVKYDWGDYFLLSLKGGYKFPVGEVGLGFLYRMKTAEKYNGTEVEGSDGNHISLYPYFKLSLPAFPVKFHLTFSVIDEYLPYGFSLAGKNAPVTRFGFTLGGSFSF